MYADIFHHLIEQGMHRKRNIEDFQDFCDVVEKSGHALVMSFEDFQQAYRVANMRVKSH